MVKVRYTRNIFIDSETNNQRGLISKHNFPPSVFSVAPDEEMKLTLTSLELRRCWYSVNQTNNTFYLYDPAGAGTYTEVVIPAGTYDAFADLATAIAQAFITAGFALTTCTYNDITRKFTITIPAAPVNSYIVCFQSRTGSPPTGVSNQGYFNDSCEILGAIPERNFQTTTPPQNAFRNTTGVAAHISPFVAALNTLEAIYLRTNLQSGNYQSASFEKDVGDTKSLIPTLILARIPLTRAYFDPQFEFISFEDTNDLFSMYLQQQHLSQVYFSLTDDKGRLLAEVAEDQADFGNLSFKISLRYEVLAKEVETGERRVLNPSDIVNKYPRI